MSRSVDNFDQLSWWPTFLQGRSIRKLVDWRETLQRRRFTRRIRRLLGRPPAEVSVRIEIEWRAAGIHAWDQDLQPDQQGRLYAARLIDDTVYRIWSLFSALPELDVAHIRVRQPDPSDGTLLAGTVSRGALMACKTCPSATMRLKLLGLNYVLRDGRLEPLP